MIWTDRPAYFIVFVASVYPVLLNTMFGFRLVSDRHLRVATIVHANWWLRLCHVVWPSAKPSICTGIRVGLGIGWMSLIAAELVAVRNGLGYLIQVNRLTLRMDNVIAVMATIGVLGMLMNYAFIPYERMSMPWREPRHDV